MGEVEVEYMGGPADGQRDTARTGPNGTPPRYRVVQTSPAWDSWLDPRPAAPAETHRYERDPDTGPPWRYRHLGPLT